MKEHAVILIWRQSEIRASAIITISFINDINIRIFPQTGRLIIFLFLMLISLIIHNLQVLPGFSVHTCVFHPCAMNNILTHRTRLTFWWQIEETGRPCWSFHSTALPGCPQGWSSGGGHFWTSEQQHPLPKLWKERLHPGRWMNMWN